MSRAERERRRRVALANIKRIMERLEGSVFSDSEQRQAARRLGEERRLPSTQDALPL